MAKVFELMLIIFIVIWSTILTIHCAHIPHNQLSPLENCVQKFEGFGILRPLKDIVPPNGGVNLLIAPYGILCAVLIFNHSWIYAKRYVFRIFCVAVLSPFFFVRVIRAYLFLWYVTTVGCILLLLPRCRPGGSPQVNKTQQPTQSDKGHVSLTTPKDQVLSKKKTLEHNDNNNGQPPSKKSRKQYHDGTPCSPCQVWIQLGKFSGDAQYHGMDKPYHPHERAEMFSSYLSASNTIIILEEDSCMCRSCYSDANKHAGKGTYVQPRWLKLKESRTLSKSRHCPLCHHESEHSVSVPSPCPCLDATQWISSNVWLLGLSVKTWQQYFNLTRNNFSSNIKESTLFCKKHYMEMYNFQEKRKCMLCSNSSNEWDFIKQCQDKLMQQLKISPDTSSPTDTVCKSCIQASFSQNTANPCTDQLQRDLMSQIPFIKDMATCVSKSIDNIKKNGYVMRSSIVQMFKDTLVCGPDKDDLLKRFDNYLTSIIKRHVEIGSFMKTSSRAGTMYYFKQSHTTVSINTVYDLITANNVLRTEFQKQTDLSVNLAEIREMFEKQTKLFASKDADFDYRSLFDTSTTDIETGQALFLGKYLHQPLFQFMKTILGLEKGDEVVEHKHNLKLQTAISVLCNIKNQNSIMFQTVVGLATYSNGLRDKGFHILNTLGLTCSIDLIRRQANKWSSTRKVVNEIDKSAFWRLTFDNLNFKRKFAKTFAVGGDVLGRMLNLLTGQVSHRKTYVQSDDNTLPSASNDPKNICENTFFNMTDDVQASYNEYLKNLHSHSSQRRQLPLSSMKTTLMYDLKQSMPHFTPNEPDNVAYATVQSAQSSSITDVSKYLLKLKDDLMIGDPGFPEKVVLGGDQQTYAIVKNLIKKYPDTFSWIIPVPGDWHLLKNAAETIKDMIWDGGLQQLSKICKHMKDIVQWRDIHNMLSSLHECLLYEAVSEMEKCDITNIDDWISKKMAVDNLDEVSRFWAQTLRYLNAYTGYFMAIRSGNFNLRNAYLPVLTELFFAYSHNKYEELACQTMNDVFKLPEDIRNHFLNGEWTISITANPFHNVALDEGHEQIINKRLKELTTRPSEYRTVTLANFMAYLDKFLSLFLPVLFYFKKKREFTHSNRIDYVQAIYQHVQAANVFNSNQPRQLKNVFSQQPIVLDNDTKNDLLTVSSEGQSRMHTYIRQHILQPPAELPRRPQRRKMKTFSRRKTTSRTQNTKLGQVTLLLKRAYCQLQRAGQYLEKTMEYPLCFCDEFGEMRERHKSKFKDAFQKVNELCHTFLPSIPFQIDEKRTEVIIDFLKYIHEPTPPDVRTYEDLGNYYWSQVVCRLGFKRDAAVVTIVLDKPDFLPHIRTKLHKERKTKTKQCAISLGTHNIEAKSSILHGTEYVNALQDQNYKEKLTSFLTDVFISKAKCLPHNRKLIIDSPSLGSSPTCVERASLSTVRCNNKGEADCAVWFHASQSDCEQILIIANDTDIWMYSLALMELGKFKLPSGLDKLVAVELSLDREYVFINEGVKRVTGVVNLQQPISCVSFLAIYLLSGSDYVSSFYGISYHRFISSFVDYSRFISTQNDPLISISDSGIVRVSTTAYTRLICSVYLDKYPRLYKHIQPNVSSLLNSFKISGSNMNQDMISLLEWLGYDKKSATLSMTSETDWLELVRRVCYFSNHGSRNLYKLIPPSDSALNLHRQRGEFILTLAIQSTLDFSDFHNRCLDYGWIKNNTDIDIKWDDNIDQKRKSLTKKRPLPISKCSCKAKENKCGLENRGCLNCCKSCKPCSQYCICKGNCKNPHNNGGHCPKCMPHATSTSDSDSDQSTIDEQDNGISEIQDYFNQTDNFLQIPPEDEANTDRYCDVSSEEESEI